MLTQIHESWVTSRVGDSAESCREGGSVNSRILGGRHRLFPLIPPPFRGLELDDAGPFTVAISALLSLRPELVCRPIPIERPRSRFGAAFEASEEEPNSFFSVGW